MSHILSINAAIHHFPVDIVWPEQKQIGLIDSVFRNYYIPPIIFGEPTSVPPPHLGPLRPSRKLFRHRMMGVRPAFV